MDKKRCEENLLLELNKARNVIRKKFYALKNLKQKAYLINEEKLSPLIQPMKELIKIKNEIDSKQDIKNEIDSKENIKKGIENSRKSSAKNLKTENNIYQSDDDEEDDEYHDSISQEEKDSDDEMNGETPRNHLTRKKLDFSDELPSPSTEYNSPIQPPFDSVAASYTKLLERQCNSVDKLMGIRKVDRKWKFGDKDVKFGKDNLIIDGKSYQMTEGLCELMFMKKPDAKIYSKGDLRTYRTLLLTSNVYRRDFEASGQISGNRGYKYKKIIQPLIEESIQEGNGFKKYSSDRYQYVYFDDPNEIVERLKILLASKYAGHNNVHNEILSIEEELRQRRIIA